MRFASPSRAGRSHMAQSTPTPSRCARHLSPFDGGEEDRPHAWLPSSPGQGERWFAKQTGVGVLALSTPMRLPVLGRQAGDQLLLGFGKVERRAVGLGDAGDQEDEEAERLQEDVPLRNEAEPVARLRVHDLAAATASRPA